MFAKLLERLGLASGDSTADAEGPDAIALAATALLLEVAWSDHQLEKAELEGIRQAVMHTFHLDDVAVAALLDESQALHADSVGVQAFTRRLTDAWDEPRRFELVVMLWRLALADGQMHQYEEHSIRRIADLLYVSHPRFIEAKLVARQSGA